MKIEEFKSHFHSGGKFVHLNNSGQALIPKTNRDLAVHWVNEFYEGAAAKFMEAWAQMEGVRGKLATFLGAEASQLSFFQTTASALSQIALSLPLSKGDEVLTWDQEYPSNFYPWRRACEKNGARLIQAPSQNWQTPIEEILSRVTPRTRAIALSWVQYQTGSVTDLRKLSDALKGRGIWLVADIIQGAGVRPFNFKESGFDFVCAGSHKYMCSAYGAAFMIGKKERLEEMFPLEVGAMTYGDPETPKSFDLQPKVGASKFEPGSKAVVEVIAMGATLDLFNEFGIQNIFDEATRVANYLRKGLEERDCKVYSPQGPIITFAPRGDLDMLIKKLTDASVTFAKRGPGIRLSTHAYNRESEIDKVLALV